MVDPHTEEPADQQTEEPEDISKLSTSKIAKKLGFKTNDFLIELVEKGFLVMDGDKHNLSEEGKNIGGEYIPKSRFGAYFLWPEDMSLTETNLVKE